MILTIWKKEMESYFTSPLAYVLIGLFSLITGIMFFNLLVTYTDGIQAIPQHMAQDISFVEEVVIRLFANINFLFLFFIPLITMRLLSEEKKQSTIDLFWLSSVKEWQVVLSKGLAALSLIFSMLVMTMIFPLIVWGVGVKDFSILGSAYLSVLLNACCYISMGLFFSSISHNQIIAGILSILGIIFLWMITWGGHLNSNYLVSEIFNYIGITSHFEKILRGLIGTQDLVYYVTFVLFFGLN
jgi:ABC-2 type transport system permease protein